MKIANICAALLIAVPVTAVVAQEMAPPGQAIGMARMPREHRWVNPLPDTVNERVHHQIYHSAVMDVDVGFGIYLPPGYDDPANADLRYPVVYFLHGGFGNEARMLDPARVDIASPMDDRILAGIVEPIIYVFPNGGSLPHYNYGDSLAETTFVQELIPLIDTQFRTIASRGGRGIEGFSSGGRGAARDMFKYPELFCSAVPLSGGHQQEKIAADNDGHLGGMTAGMVIDAGDNSWDLAEEYAAGGSDPLLQILVVVGTDDMNYEANLEWMEHLESVGVEFEQHIIPGIPHDPVLIYEKYGNEIMAFHQSCFGAVLGKAKL
jgi:enterochelin esterase-like enzyme